MNFFRVFTSRAKTGARADAVSRAQLPELNAFVEIAIGNNRKRRSVSIDAIENDTLTTRLLPDLCVGAVADFLYSNSCGTFRFSTVCAGLDAHEAHFKIPSAIKTIVDFGSKRGAVRLDSMMPVHWRYAPGGVGNGEFVKGSMTDLSRGGASLVVGRELKLGTQVEVRFTLKIVTDPLVLLSQVVRAGKIESSGKNTAGIHFLRVDGPDERLIDEFIHDRQVLRRKRGVV